MTKHFCLLLPFLLFLGVYSHAQEVLFDGQIILHESLDFDARERLTKFDPKREETKVLDSISALYIEFTNKQRTELAAHKNWFIACNGDTIATDAIRDMVIKPATNAKSFKFSILRKEECKFVSLAGLDSKGVRIKLVKAFPEKPFFTNDAIVFGILMLLLAMVFYTSSKSEGFWKKLHVFLPALLLCYLLPSVLSSLGIISSDWIETDAYGNGIKAKSSIYFVASRYLLPAALILLTLSLDLKAVLKLGWKAVAMFLTGTVGIIIGGPIAILLVALVSPETVGGAGIDAVWRGLSTLAGSWIGGGANQTAMLEVYKYNADNYGAMVLVDIVVANIWMAVLLFGIGKKDRIDKWFKADTKDIEDLKQRVMDYEKSVLRIPTLKDLMLILGLAFIAVALAHWGADSTFAYLKSKPTFQDPKNFASTFADHFFWLVMFTTLIGVALSFTRFKKLEGAGASKIGSVFIYVLVASIGMKMDLKSVVNNPGLIVVGLIWMTVHALLLILIAKLIRAPFFFLAVGSKANVGGAASAPVVASAFHPSLASVGVILAIFGYVLGTLGAILSAELMRIAAGG